MTIEEAQQAYGYQEYRVSEGDTLLRVCRLVYGSDATLYRRILEVLNPRIDWLGLSIGTVVRYLPPSVVGQQALY